LTEYNYTGTISDKDFEVIGRELKADYSDLKELVERALEIV
jgi:hypothetical protein